MESKCIDVGILGATGMVGQQFILQLANHPWFRPVWFAASERSEGKAYGDAATWRLASQLPDEIRAARVEACTPGRGPQLIFSALDANAAKDLEPAFAKAGHLVISNARSYRMDPLVPLLIPEINDDHLALLPAQRRARGWARRHRDESELLDRGPLDGACAAAGNSGCGPSWSRRCRRSRGPAIPASPRSTSSATSCRTFRGEEEKMESETQKILGALQGDAVSPHPVIVSAQATRVPVIDGHTESISVALDSSPSIADVVAALREFRGRPQELGLPSAPAAPIVCVDALDRPQPRLDVERDGGMTVTVGRVRPCPVLDVKFVALGHNTIRGAAGAAVLNAELMLAEGLLRGD